MNEIEVSVVIPCLNEADTLQTCLQKAKGSLERAGIRHELVVADNGSTDSSAQIAKENGARVVPVAERGYGAALMGGIGAARGKYVIMGDADDSYDFSECPKFVAKLREGYDIVQGCRLPAGGGKVMPGAMPWSHRWIGNPLFSFLARRWFSAPIHDIYCGLRAFTSDCYQKLNLRCTGMEFATEMIVKASIQGVSFSEVPICLHPDGRKAHAPHLKTMRDGWRTLRLLLMCSPNWLFALPGSFLMALGAIGYVLVYGGFRVGKVQPDAHSLLFSSAIFLCGYMAVSFSFIMKTFALREGWQTLNPLLDNLYKWFNLERGLIAGMGCILIGLALMVWALAKWAAVDFGELDYRSTMRVAIPGSFLLALGVQTCFMSFFSSSVGMWRK
jgi:glycosyltransferase involved in cell wall biosynthesis